MSDSWEDWENEVPVLNVPTVEQLKRLEEQRLIEESDIELAKDLISGNKKEEEDLALLEIKQTTKFMQLPNDSLHP